MNGDLFPLKEAYSRYLGRWYASVVATTPALEVFKARGLRHSMMWAAGRMVDQADDMLDSYRRNANSATPNEGAKLPVVIVAMAKDYTATTGDVGGRQLARRMVSLSEEHGASVYGYRQAMGDVRTQVAIFAYEEASARGLATQFTMFIGEIGNRRFKVPHKWGQYEFETTCLLETPDIIFQSVDSGQKNLTILVADVTLRAVVPYLDAPAEGEPNDGSNNNPPGYPVVLDVNVNGKEVVTHPAPLLFDDDVPLDDENDEALLMPQE